MSEHSILRTIRNWPRKLVGLHKTDKKITKTMQLISDLSAENNRLRNTLDKVAERQYDLLYYRNLLNMGEAALFAVRENNIFSLIKKYAGHIDLHNMQFFIDFAADFCGKAFISNHYSIDSISEKIKDNKAELFISELREKFLHPAEYDITASHNISRPFRFWSQQEKQDYIYAALEIISILKTLSPYCAFGYGTALAAKRDGHLIPHDDDIDIIFCLPKSYNFRTRQEARAYIKAIFLEKNFKIGDWPRATHIQVYVQPHKMLDVFIACENEVEDSAAYAEWIPGPSRGFALNRLFPTQNLLLEGIEIPCPHAIDDYLTALYGKHWHIADTNFHHVWRAE